MDWLKEEMGGLPGHVNFYGGGGGGAGMGGAIYAINGGSVTIDSVNFVRGIKRKAAMVVKLRSTSTQVTIMEDEVVMLGVVLEEGQHVTYRRRQ